LALLLVVGGRGLDARAPEPAAVPVNPGTNLERRARELADADRLVEAEAAQVEAVRAWEPGASGGDAACRARWGRAHNDLAALQGRLHKFADAQALCGKTIQLLEGLATRFPAESDLRFEQARTHRVAADCYRTAGLPLEAVEQQRRGVRLLAQLARDHSRREDYRRELALRLTEHGNELVQLGRYAESETELREAVTVAAALAADFPQSAEPVQDLAAAHAALAQLGRESGRYTDASRSLVEAIRLLQRLAAEQPERPDLWRTLPFYCRSLAQVVTSANRPAEAEAARQAAGQWETRLARFPAPAAKPLRGADLIVGTLQDLDTARLIKKKDELDTVLRASANGAKEHPEAPVFRVSLVAARMVDGLRLYAQGQPEEGQRQYRAALDAAQRLAADFPDVPQYRSVLGEVYCLNGGGCLIRGDVTAAEKFNRAGYDTFERLAADQPMVPLYLYRWSNAFATECRLRKTRGERREAARRVAASVAVLKRLVTDFPTSPEYRRQYIQGTFTLSNAYQEMQAHAEVEATLREGVRLWGQAVADFPTLGTFQMFLGNAQANLARYLADRGRPQEAEEGLRAALRSHQRLIESQPEEPSYRAAIAVVHAWCATHLESQKRLAEAAEAYASSAAALEAALKLAPRQREWLGLLRGTARQRAFLLLNLGRTAEYQAELRREQELGERLDRPLTRLLRVDSRIQEGQVAPAANEAEDLFQTGDLEASQWYDLATAFVRLAEVSKGDSKQALAARAVQSLSRAVEMGHPGVANVRDDPQFKLLAGRADFEQLLPAVQQTAGVKR
jgi:tetratricopeptide (TPR) repeat protein